MPKVFRRVALRAGEVVRFARGRWRVEHSDRELEDEPGINHFAGRSWRGWNRRVTPPLLASPFLVETRLKLGKRGSKPVPAQSSLTPSTPSVGFLTLVPVLPPPYREYPADKQTPHSAPGWIRVEQARSRYRIASGLRRSSSVPRVTPTRLAACNPAQTSRPVTRPASRSR